MQAELVTTEMVVVKDETRTVYVFEATTRGTYHVLTRYNDGKSSARLMVLDTVRDHFGDEAADMAMVSCGPPVNVDER